MLALGCRCAFSALHEPRFRADAQPGQADALGESTRTERTVSSARAEAAAQWALTKTGTVRCTQLHRGGRGTVVRGRGRQSERALGPRHGTHPVTLTRWAASGRCSGDARDRRGKMRSHACAHGRRDARTPRTDLSPSVLTSSLGTPAGGASSGKPCWHCWHLRARTRIGQ